MSDITQPISPAPTVPSDLAGLPETDDNIREIRPALLRGWRRRCPQCGGGPLLKSYLKVRDECAVCGEELHHHRADDGPAYLTILVVGHILGPLMGWFYVEFRADPLTNIAIFSTVAVALSLYLLPRFKGAIVGFQWAKRMHGFGRDPS